jgi:hypothetical protein
LRRVANVCLFVLVLAIGCKEDANHENIQRWRTTQKGPEKLSKALTNEALSAELRGHAAEQIVLMDKFADVKRALDAMPEQARRAVIEDLSARLWEDARIAREMDEPTTEQRMAKDALFDLRPMANEKTRAQIDKYLIEWLTGGYYEGRARSGRVGGKYIIRAIGASAGPPLVNAARSILTRPPETGGGHARIGDELLTGLAVSAHPEAIALVLTLVKKNQGDETLSERAMAALFEAYVEPVGFEKVDGKALKPQVKTLQDYARDESLSGRVNNDATALIAAAGMPECVPAFVDLVSYPVSSPDMAKSLRWVGAQQAVRCGGVESIIPVAEALPQKDAYDRAVIDRYFWSEIRALSSRRAIAEKARALLDSKSWVARVTGIELLRGLKLPGESAEDAKRIRGLAGDSKVLPGWWKSREDLPEAERKKDPTLGQVAQEVAKGLQELAQGSETK